MSICMYAIADRTVWTFAGAFGYFGSVSVWAINALHARLYAFIIAFHVYCPCAHWMFSTNSLFTCIQIHWCVQMEMRWRAFWFAYTHMELHLYKFFFHFSVLFFFVGRSVDRSFIRIESYETPLRSICSFQSMERPLYKLAIQQVMRNIRSYLMRFFPFHYRIRATTYVSKAFAIHINKFHLWREKKKT